MSTEFKTKIDGVNITRYSGGDKGPMFLISKKLKSNRELLYSNWDVYHKLSTDSIALTKEETKKIALQLLEIIKEKV